MDASIDFWPQPQKWTKRFQLVLMLSCKKAAKQVISPVHICLFDSITDLLKNCNLIDATNTFEPSTLASH
jgi:hypothetical protein